MQLTIHLPSREETLAFNRQRWGEILADPRWNACDERIETNAFGNILMSPPASGSHCKRQFRIGGLLERLLAERGLPGEGFGECPISTIDGVKACDAAWFSAERYARVRGQQAYEEAPEICVEVVSPSNTENELQHKRSLYFEAGAMECWRCDQQGRMTFYYQNAPDVPKPRSEFCPEFPVEISD